MNNTNVKEGQIWRSNSHPNLFIRLEATNGNRWCFLMHTIPTNTNLNTYNFEKGVWKNDNFAAGAIEENTLRTQYSFFDLNKDHTKEETVKLPINKKASANRLDEID